MNLRRLLANPSALIGLVCCVLVLAGALLAPWLAPYDPIDQDIIDRLQPPSADFLLGTDAFGRDVFSRILWGARISLLVAVCSTAAAIVVGGAIGAVSGYVGGRVDRFVMQVMDVLLSFPSLILGLVTVALLGPRSSTSSSPSRSPPSPRSRASPARRCSRSKQRAFIEAGRALGSRMRGSSSSTSCPTS